MKAVPPTSGTAPVPRRAAAEGEYIQKVLARSGSASRREAEAWLRAGRVTLNGRPAVPGERAGPGDRLRLDGRPVRLVGGAGTVPRVLLYHKPAGRICTRNDPRGRPTVYEQLPALGGGAWISVGRLDFNTSGLLLFSNGGDLVQRLAHPSGGVEREYAVRIYGRPSPAQLKRLLGGVMLDGRRARFTRIRPMTGAGGGRAARSNHWYRVVVLEGRKHEVRRLWETQRLVVSRLVRIRFGPLLLPPDLPPGACRELPSEQVHRLPGSSGPAASRRDARKSRRRPAPAAASA